jgi:uncharacterized protein (DUF362 family)
MLGFEELAKQKNIRLVNLSEQECNDVSVSCNGKKYDLKVPQIIPNADLRINNFKNKIHHRPHQTNLCSKKHLRLQSGT